MGVEFASIYRSFGCEVTIIEMLPRLVPVEDEEVSKELARAYRKRGIAFHTSAKVEKIEKTKSGIAVTISAEGKQQKIEAEKILIAVGRKPRTENIGLEKTKIKPERGFIQTDSWMHTAEPGVYAMATLSSACHNSLTSAPWRRSLRWQKLRASRVSQLILNIYPGLLTAIRKSAA